ncbi:MAG: glycosyltransferase family 2 protein [Prevotellaceae bacterium]|jgi:GT2 family glycosyltransferase|nr:glycosyltransferase family 2 protein [Prevotellaceae bacterium]
MSIAIVILNYNGRHFLEKFLPDVIRRSPGTEIVVADNGSSDGSLAYLHTLDKVRVITFEKNYGFADGYNRALKQISATYYILLNSDVAVADGWLKPLRTYMNEHPHVAACQPKVRSYHAPDKFEHAGAAGGYIDRYGYPFCRGRVFGTVETDHGQYDDTASIFWATGACLMIRSDCFWQAGGFDGRFFAHMEEIDLCWRLKARGHTIVCVPQSVIYHIGGGTLRTESAHKTFLNFRNNWLLLFKNLSPEAFKAVAMRRRLLDWGAACHFLFTFRPQNALQVFCAHRAFRRMKPDFLPDRQANMQAASAVHPEGIFDGLLPKSYYLDKKKTFSMLKDSITNASPELPASLNSDH